MRRSSSIGGRPSTGGRPSMRVRNENAGGGGAVSKLPKPSASAGTRLSHGGAAAGSRRPSYGAANSRLSYGAGAGRPSYGVTGASGGQRSAGHSRHGSALMDSNKRRASSMLHYGSHHEQMKDPRPIGERSYKDRCVQKLIQFLSEQKYPYQLSPKLLHSPTTKDFIKIFEFLVGHFCPKFKCGPKIEEKIPRSMRSYGYPFPISKSSMFTVGSPHTWPTLLAALTWLRERIELEIHTDIESLLFAPSESGDDFDKVSEEKILFQHVEQCYQEFMRGSDNFQHLDEELESKITENIAGDTLDDIAERNGRLREELSRLEQQPDQLRSEQRNLDNFQADEIKLTDYLTTLKSHKDQQEMRLKGIEDELEESELQLKQGESENARLQRIHDTQEFSRADLVGIKESRDQLQRSITTLHAELDDVDKKTWDLEICIRKEHDKCEVKCRQYNDIGFKLQMIPFTAENSFGVDYELKPGNVQQKCATTVKPALVHVLKQCEEKLVGTFKEKLKEEEAQDQQADMLTQARDCVKRQDTVHRRLIETLDVIKEKHQREYEQKLMEVDTLEQELAMLRKPTMTTYEMNKKFKEDKAKYEKLRIEREQQHKQSIEFLIKAATMCLDHKAVLQTKAKELVSKLEGKVARLKAQERKATETS